MVGTPVLNFAFICLIFLMNKHELKNTHNSLVSDVFISLGYLSFWGFRGWRWSRSWRCSSRLGGRLRRRFRSRSSSRSRRRLSSGLCSRSSSWLRGRLGHCWLSSRLLRHSRHGRLGRRRTRRRRTSGHRPTRTLRSCDRRASTLLIKSIRWLFRGRRGRTHQSRRPRARSSSAGLCCWLCGLVLAATKGLLQLLHKVLVSRGSGRLSIGANGLGRFLVFSCSCFVSGRCWHCIGGCSCGRLRRWCSSCSRCSRRLSFVRIGISRSRCRCSRRLSFVRIGIGLGSHR